MSHPVAPLRLTIVIEWGNVRLAEASRPKRMLERLADELGRQLQKAGPGRGLASPVQIVLAYDGAALRDARPDLQLREALAPIRAELDLTLLNVSGAGYYELKNRALECASGEVVLLLDSDVIPEPGWLEHLLEPFADPAVEVVGSNSYVEPCSTYARAFALGWLFPRRASDGPLHEASRFYSNSVAFRTGILRHHPFPALPGASRGAGSLLADALREKGIRIHQCPRARVAHPAPRPRHFLRRAMAQGRDNLLSQRARSRTGEVPPGRSWGRILGRTTRAWQRIVRRGDRVGMKRAEIPLALAIITLYYGLVWAGDALTRVAPKLMRRHFRI